MRLMTAIVLLWFAFGAGPAALADQNDERLDGLFRDLKAASDPLSAMIVESEIWRIWSQSGDTNHDQVFERGTRALSKGDYRAAFANFAELTRTAPDFAEGWNKLATVEYLMGDYQSSLRSIDRTLALEPRHFGALSGLGLVNMELRREEAALDAFERVLSIYPMSDSARANAAFVREILKEKAI